VLELGGNDALRGCRSTTRAQPARDGALAKAAGAKVLIVGMQCRRTTAAPTATTSRRSSPTSRRRRRALVPFLLKGVADVPQAESMFQPDRIHPLASAHPTILANVWPVLRRC
jgi:acyl-CoA thioesterase-1